MSTTSTLPLPWHEALWQRLRAQWQAGRPPHALLLAGPAGTGKRQFAAALAASLLCRSVDADGYACGRCRGCELFATGHHPDWLRVGPEGSSRTIRIDAVREVAGFLAQTAQQGGCKVVELAPAEAMNRHAANALLKSLEEPAGESLLLLVADHPALLPATLRSRCQRLTMVAPASTETLPWLLSVAPDEASAGEALAEAGGRPLLARELLDPARRTQRRQRDAALLQLLRGETDPVSLAAAWQDQADDALQEWLIQRLQRGVSCALGGQAPQTDLERAWASTNPRSLLRWLDQLLQQRRRQLAGVVPNRQLALESMLLPACELDHA